MGNILTRFLTFFAVHGLTHMLTMPLESVPKDWRALRYTLTASLCFLIVMAALAGGTYCLSLIAALWPF